MKPVWEGEWVAASGWWSSRTGVQKFDLYTRAPLYAASASEPAVALLLVGGQTRVRPWGAVILLLVAVAHTVACMRLLRAGIGHALGERDAPSPRLVGLAAALTGAGLVAGYLAFPSYSRALTGAAFPVGLPITVLFCGAVTAAVTPLLSARLLLVVVAAPAMILGALHTVTTASDARFVWGLDYLIWVGTVVLIYRPSVWFLGIMWETERSRAVQARLAVAEERLRFARDLHDVLGRNLALIAVSSDLAAQLVGHDQEAAVEHMGIVRQTAQDSLREMRAVVAGYRSADLDSELAGARSVLRSAGINARVIGDGSGLPQLAQDALGWVVREAITNIIRHSDATTATIELETVPDGTTGSIATLRIENDGAHPASTNPRSGTGLVGLRERLAAIGGELDAAASPKGRYVVQARLPLTPSPAVKKPAPEPAR